MEFIEIDNLKLIGGGGNWKVYQGNVITEKDNPVIIKTNDNICEEKIDGNIKNYDLTKSLNLPTLKFFKKAKLNQQFIILAENLNNISDIIYVTPNSVKTIAHKELEQLSDKKSIESETEQKLYENKIKTINNLFDFIQEIKLKLIEISSLKIVLEYDCYFLGISNHNMLDYKIADFDTIFECENKTTEECYQINLDELNRVLTLFIEHFVIKSQQNLLQSIVNENVK